MGARSVRFFVYVFSTAAVGLLALSPGNAADSVPAPAADPMGMNACCGTPPPTEDAKEPAGSMQCGPGTHLESGPATEGGPVLKRCMPDKKP